jgi:hypothetical protein
VFSIQLIVVDGEGAGQHKVVETLTSPRLFVYDAEHRAKLALKHAKRRPSDVLMPTGWIVLDSEGRQVACSWEPTKP